jgi:GNAT superfamily N-acetyltransferase
MTGHVTVAPADAATDWRALRALLGEAFAAMDGVIDPPSSLRRMDAAALAALPGTWLLARDAQGLAGCLHAAPRGDALYLSKIAVAARRRRSGVARALVEAAAALAGPGALTLSSRVELRDAHAAFRTMGFVETGRTAHPGFARPTSIAFRREASARWTERAASC